MVRVDGVGLIVKQALAEGVNSLKELYRRTGISPGYFWQLMQREDLQIPDNLIPYRYKPEMDALIDKEDRVTLQEIGIAGGYPEKSARENARQYLIYSGQHRIWEERQQELKNRIKNETGNFRRELVLDLEARISQLSRVASWPEQMAMRYLQSVKYNVAAVGNYRKLIKLFRKYESAQNRGKKFSLEELGKSAGYVFTNVQRIFRYVGLRPMYGTKKEQPKEIKETAKRAARLKIGEPDISYFLRVRGRSVDQYLRREGVLRIHPNYLAQIGHKIVTYRLGSQIYEAQDAEFKKNEIAELLDTSREIVTHVINDRSRLAPKIVRVLKALYSSQDIRKPYVTSVKT